MSVVVRRYIDILTIIINFLYSNCVSSFFGCSIPTSLFIFKNVFSVFIYIYIYIYIYILGCMLCCNCFKYFQVNLNTHSM